VAVLLLMGVAMQSLFPSWSDLLAD
jgi:hypothetical protein